MKKHLELLGFPVRDQVSGFKGVVTSISFDLYGCVQAIVSPTIKDTKKQTQEDSRWFDVKRLKKTAEKPVMELPTFETVPGAAEKPGQRQNPLP